MPNSAPHLPTLLAVEAFTQSRKEAIEILLCLDELLRDAGFATALTLLFAEHDADRKGDL